MKSPYLFCRIEIEKNDNFDNKQQNPAAYYIDKVWAPEVDSAVKSYSIPIFFWYWKNKSGQMTVSDLSSYHYNPSPAGDFPPFSMEELMNATDSKFKSYKAEPAKFARYPTYELYSSSNKQVGYYADNQNGDDEGVMFPCDQKKTCRSYTMTFDLSGYAKQKKLSVN